MFIETIFSRTEAPLGVQQSGAATNVCRNETLLSAVAVTSSGEFVNSF
jgi:hypothetical protein